MAVSFREGISWLGGVWIHVWCKRRALWHSRWDVWPSTVRPSNKNGSWLFGTETTGCCGRCAYVCIHVIETVYMIYVQYLYGCIWLLILSIIKCMLAHNCESLVLGWSSIIRTPTKALPFPHLLRHLLPKICTKSHWCSVGGCLGTWIRRNFLRENSWSTSRLRMWRKLSGHDDLTLGQREVCFFFFGPDGPGV